VGGLPVIGEKTERSTVRIRARLGGEQPSKRTFRKGKNDGGKRRRIALQEGPARDPGKGKGEKIGGEVTAL